MEKLAEYSGSKLVPEGCCHLKTRSGGAPNKRLIMMPREHHEKPFTNGISGIRKATERCFFTHVHVEFEASRSLLKIKVNIRFF